MTYLELVFDFGKFFSENSSFFPTPVYFLLENLGPALEHLNQSGLAHIANVVAFVFKDDALGADVDLVVLAPKLGALVRMLQTVLFRRLLLLLVLLFLLLLGDVLLAVEVVQDGEVLY